MAKKSKPEQKEECLLPFPDIEFYNKWQEWLTYRKQRRLPAYVAIGLNRTFDKLKKDSGNDVKIAMAIIDQSIALSYQGLFPLKNQYNYGSSQKITGTGLKEAIINGLNG